MNNDEKREYISQCIVLQSRYMWTPEYVKRDFIKHVPTSLYKYKKIDGYLFDMIDNQNIYLASAIELDDPFECWTNVDFSEVVEPGTEWMNEKTMNLIFSEVLNFLNSDEKKKLAETIYRDCIRNGDFSAKLALEYMAEYSNIFNSFEQRVMLNTFANFRSTLDPKTRGKEIKSIVLTAKNAKNIVGIFSLADSKINKTMWDLYANNNKGCCIEFDFTESEYVKSLLPVIYETKQQQHNIIKALILFNANALVRRFSEGEIKSDMSQLYAPYITKEMKWSYQNEWRILGTAHHKMPIPKIKAVYLGFDISPENQKFLIERAKKFGFKLYKSFLDNDQYKFAKVELPE